jgi:hypothetical protein
MTIRKALAAVAVGAGVALALQGAPAQADTQTQTLAAQKKCTPMSDDASDLSPKSRKAWSAFICGGGHVTGGMARMVSGAWIGSPTIIASATGQDVTADQAKAWKNWDKGAYNAGRGAAMVVSGAWIGAPSTVIDIVKGGAVPADLTPAQLEKVTFLMPAGSPFAKGYDVADPEVPEVPELPLLIDPLELLMELLGGVGV